MTRELLPALFRTSHFIFPGSSQAAANISPAWLAGYCHKSDTEHPPPSNYLGLSGCCTILFWVGSHRKRGLVYLCCRKGSDASRQCGVERKRMEGIRKSRTNEEMAFGFFPVEWEAAFRFHKYCNVLRTAALPVQMTHSIGKAILP